jgi:hypothetical protein
MSKPYNQPVVSASRDVAKLAHEMERENAVGVHTQSE